MDSEFWRERWKQGQIGFHLDEPNPRLLENAAVLPVRRGAVVLVPLCGKSVDLRWLAEQGYRVIGVELSELAVQAFFSEQSLQAQRHVDGPFIRYTSPDIELICGDFFALSQDAIGLVDGFYDRAALVALPPELRRQYVNHLAGLIQPEARGLLVTFEYPQTEMNGPPFSVPEAEVEALYAQDFHVTLLAAHDILAEQPRFRERLTSLQERAHSLVRLGDAL